jgi:hypothetical protein
MEEEIGKFFSKCDQRPSSVAAAHDACSNLQIHQGKEWWEVNNPMAKSPI